MSEYENNQLTELLLAWNEGDNAALETLMPIVYEELRQIARRYMRKERQNHTLQTSALINEAYLRLIEQKNVRWQNRAQFFALSSQMMRRILVDYARTRGYAKRGGDAVQVTLDEAILASDKKAADLLSLDDALNQLAELDERQSKIVEMRFFGGLSIEETAHALNISPATVKREWSSAKAFLYKVMTDGF